MSAVVSERTKRIEAAIHQPSAKSEAGKSPVVIAGRKELLPVYRLPTSLLAFNIRNGRFAAELKAKEHQLGKVLNPLVPEDQGIIQDLLVTLDRGATELLKRDIKAIGQTDPGIITHDGFVINGNRRLAVLHLLHSEDRTGRFEYLEVVRLPADVSEKDLWRIEAGLQLSRDKRLEYGPVNDLLKIREGLNAGLTPEEIAAALYGVESPEEITAKDERLKLIDSYLGYIGATGEHTRVEGYVEHFINLQDFLKWLIKQRVSAKERSEWLFRAFWFIRAGLGHMKIRRLRDIYQSEEAKKHLLDAVKPHEGKWAPEIEETRRNDIKEQFAVAEDYVQLREEEDKPEKLLSRAERSLEALRKHQSQLAKTPALHQGVQHLLKIAQEIAAVCVPSKPRAKTHK
jgi:hypothetical protein